jgi:hypothetical protein
MFDLCDGFVSIKINIQQSKETIDHFLNNPRKQHFKIKLTVGSLNEFPGNNGRPFIVFFCKKNFVIKASLVG